MLLQAGPLSLSLSKRLIRKKDFPDDPKLLLGGFAPIGAAARKAYPRPGGSFGNLVSRRGLTKWPMPVISIEPDLRTGHGSEALRACRSLSLAANYAVAGLLFLRVLQINDAHAGTKKMSSQV